jgi:hypothetical protein
MHTCPLLRVSMKSRNVAAKQSFATCANISIPRYWLAMLLASLAGLVGWRALRDVLNAIPDSNDDFGLF